jgi:hypothetical protein
VNIPQTALRREESQIRFHASCRSRSHSATIDIARVDERFRMEPPLSRLACIAID